MFCYRDVRLHLLPLTAHLRDPFLLLLQPGLQVVQDVLQLLLPGGEAGTHLLRLGTQLDLRLELLLQGHLLCNQLGGGG